MFFLGGGFLYCQSYDKCFLGSSETADANRVFCGQLGAIYVFSEALNPAQIFAIHQLGPGYKVRERFLITHCSLYSLHPVHINVAATLPWQLDLSYLRWLYKFAVGIMKSGFSRKTKGDSGQRCLCS